MLSSDKRLCYLVNPLLRCIGDLVFLDVACGYGRWGNQIVEYSNPSILIGVDVWVPYLKVLHSRRIYDNLILADATRLPLRNKSIDICIACEVIEHFSRRDGDSFLQNIENISREKVIITTPNYEYIQGPISGNQYERHLTYWVDGDFKKRGYAVKGIGFHINGKKIFKFFPLIGKVLNRLILFGILTYFSELIVGIKEPSLRLSHDMSYIISQST